MTAKPRRRQVVEESLLGRVAVFASVAVSILALALTAGAQLTALGCLVAVALGYRVSWRGRHRRRSARGQVLLGLLLVGAVGYLLADLFFGVFGGALPQAKFALLTIAVTSFDLKSRRNLYSHTWHGLAILYVASLFAWDPTFLPWALAWSTCVFVFLAATRDRGLAATSSVGQWTTSQVRAGVRRLAPWTAAWLVLAGIAFLVLPRFSGRPLAVPLLISLPLQQDTSAEVLPSVLPLVGTSPGQTAEGTINLRVRGSLGDEVVMRVRAPARSYWRAYTLEEYQGQSWRRVPHPATPLGAVSSNIHIVDEPGTSTTMLPQTFYILRPLTLDVPASYPLRELYFPARLLTLTQTGTVHAPYALRGGVNYAAVSEVRDTSPAALRAAGPLSDVDVPADLAVPSGIPGRVKQLSDQLTQGRTTEFDRVAAVANHLRTNYRYSLNTPRLPTGADAVDRFLFEDHVGFCEQFASALAVMLRYEGIPTRLAVGYATGDHDAFTGTFTVHARDAHAWVEVLFPGVGWVPFDASPSFPGLPTAAAPTRWFLSDFSPNFALLSVGGIDGRITGLGGLAIIAALVGLGWAWRARERAGLLPEVRTYQRAQWWLRRGGLPARRAADTPAEHLARLERVSPVVCAAMTPVATAAVAALYGGRAPARRPSTVPVALHTLRHRLGTRR